MKAWGPSSKSSVLMTSARAWADNRQSSSSLAVVEAITTRRLMRTAMGALAVMRSARASAPSIGRAGLDELVHQPEPGGRFRTDRITGIRQLHGDRRREGPGQAKQPAGAGDQ